jgi:hypothetical protein
MGAIRRLVRRPRFRRSGQLPYHPHVSCDTLTRNTQDRRTAARRDKPQAYVYPHEMRATRDDASAQSPDAQALRVDRPHLEYREPIQPATLRGAHLRSYARLHPTLLYVERRANRLRVRLCHASGAFLANLRRLIQPIRSWDGLHPDAARPQTWSRSSWDW